MGKKMKYFTDAICALFIEDDNTSSVAKNRAYFKSAGEFQGFMKDKENMRNDRRKIYSDINIAIKEGYGKIAAQ